VPSLLEEDDDTLFVKHLYIERRMTPLNIYLDRASDAEKAQVVDEYGRAIKQLAAANIFAGDLLFKNFGVTRFGRVVFYDYDEIDYLTNFNFRRMPVARTYEEEMSSETWYTVEHNDVFPEEFSTFLLVNDQVRAHFMAHHADLLDADMWRATQERIASGRIEDVFPYPSAMRFQNRFAARLAA
jgi:isocitrate dehydrogenase kinase/phosphatase